MDSKQRRWIGTHQFPLIWRIWDNDEAVVFHPGSGDTHLLNAVSTAILKSVDGHPRTTAEISAETADAFGTTADADYQSRVERLLSEFDELGLVEVVA